MNKIRKCVVIASHPRSGTHITLDFIRRNFPAFRATPQIWESASRLYLSLGQSGLFEGVADSVLLTKSGNLLVKTHCIDGPARVTEQLANLFAIDEVIYIYPFRTFSKTMKSFAEFLRFESSVGEFLGSRDRFFGLPYRVAECARLHGENWLVSGVAFLNVDDLMSNPDTTCAALGALLGEPAIDIKRRLPRKKIFYGKLSEVAERLTGRESSEVQIRYQKSWIADKERQSVDELLRELYAAMTARKIN